MLNRSAFIRVALFLVVAAVVAGLIQHYLPSAIRDPEPEAVTASKNAPNLAETQPRPQARPTETPRPPPAKAQPEPAREEPSAPAQDTATAVPPPPPPPPRAPEPQAPAQEVPNPSRTAPPAPEPPEEAAAENAGPRAVDLVDLNTASLAQLNGLKGGGAIGRTIIQHRPYASVDQLLSKRVLNRATYQRIKDQVTAR